MSRRYIIPQLEKALRDYRDPMHFKDLASLIGEDEKLVVSSLSGRVRMHPSGSIRRVARGTYQFVSVGSPAAATPQPQPAQIRTKNATNRIVYIVNTVRALVDELEPLVAEVDTWRVKSLEYDRMMDRFKQLSQ